MKMSQDSPSPRKGRKSCPLEDPGHPTKLSWSMFLLDCGQGRRDREGCLVGSLVNHSIHSKEYFDNIFTGI